MRLAGLFVAASLTSDLRWEGCRERPSSPRDRRMRKATWLGDGLRHQLQHYNDRQTNTGVSQVKEKILTVDVIDVAVVCVCPLCRPRINHNERVTTVLKSRLPLN